MLIIYIILNSSYIPIHYEPISKQDYYYEILSKKYKGLNQKIIDEIFYCSEKFQIEPELLIALSMQESGLSQYAIGKNKGSLDKGFFMVNDRYFNHPQIYDPAVNTFLGASYLRYCLDRSSSIREALYLYNSGKKYPVKFESELRADFIIFYYLKLQYSYQKYMKDYKIVYI